MLAPPLIIGAAGWSGGRPVGDRKLRRIGELPEACTRPAPDGPPAAFDVFWQSFEENCPFFSAKGIDWHAVRERYRPTVDAKTTRDELFDVFSDMVRPLNDAHIAVRHGDSVFARVRPGTTVPTGELDTKVQKFIVERALKDARNLQEFANGRITYADLPGGQGYLRISGFGGYAGGDTSYTSQLAQLRWGTPAPIGRRRPARPSPSPSPSARPRPRTSDAARAARSPGCPWQGGVSRGPGMVRGDFGVPPYGPG